MTTLQANGPIQATHELPQWICHICQIKRPARVEDLLQKVAKLSLSQPRTIENYILRELDRRTRSGKLRYMRCLPNINFTVSLKNLKGLDLPTRVKNRLGALIEERGRNLKLRELRFHDLMGTPGMGAKSTLVFLNYFDGLGAPASAFKRVGPEEQGDVEEDPVHQKEALSRLVIEWKSMPWTEQVVIGDARFPEFRALCTLLQAEFGDSLDQALRFWEESAWYLSPGDSVAIEAELIETLNKVQKLEGMKLDEALRGYVSAHCRKANIQHAEAMLARFGLHGGDPLGLRKTGQMIGRTGEAVRRIEDRLTGQMAGTHHQIIMPGLDEALNLLNGMVGAGVDEAAEALRDGGVTEQHVSVDTVLRFAGLCNRTSPAIFIERLRDGQRAVSRVGIDLNGIHRACQKLCRRDGMADVSLVAQEFPGADPSELGGVAKRLLSGTGLFVPLDGDQRWWMQSSKLQGKRNVLVCVARKMLSVTNPISAGSLVDGLFKQVAVRNAARGPSSKLGRTCVPSEAAVLGFFAKMPGYTVINDTISSDAFLDYREELASVERVLVEACMASPTGVVTMDQLAKEGKERNMSPYSLFACVRRSPLVRRLGRDGVKLIGRQTDLSLLNAPKSGIVNGEAVMFQEARPQ